MEAKDEMIKTLSCALHYHAPTAEMLTAQGIMIFLVSEIMTQKGDLRLEFTLNRLRQLLPVIRKQIEEYEQKALA